MTYSRDKKKKNLLRLRYCACARVSGGGDTGGQLDTDSWTETDGGQRDRTVRTGGVLSR